LVRLRCVEGEMKLCVRTEQSRLWCGGWSALIPHSFACPLLIMNNPNPPANPQNPNPPNQQNPPPGNQQNPNPGNQQNPNPPNQQNPGQNPQSNANSQSSSSTIPQSAPVGGLTYTQPAQTAAASYYKIAPGELITFGWNYTLLLSTPTHLTMSAFCSDNGNTYPVGPTDGIIPGTATSVVWDPWAYQGAHQDLPLIMGSYTLSVWDERGPTATPQPGLFSANAQLHFALYTTQSYQPLASGWQCQGCNAASPNSVARGFPVALIATCLVLLLSGLGILRTVMGIRVRAN